MDKRRPQLTFFTWKGPNAGETNTQASAASQAPGQSAIHAGWRVRSRRDSPCPPGQTRRALHGTSHRHRIIQGAPGRSTVASTATRENLRANATQSSAGLPQRSPTMKRPSFRRSRATLRALQREGHEAASRLSLARHARRIARSKSAAERSGAALKAARTRSQGR